jgi:hypothetical protein
VNYHNATKLDFDIDHLGYLRGELSLLQFLKPGTPVRRSKDMGSLADTLEILHSTPSKIVLPANLRGLIGLLKNLTRNTMILSLVTFVMNLRQ